MCQNFKSLAAFEGWVLPCQSDLILIVFRYLPSGLFVLFLIVCFLKNVFLVMQGPGVVCCKSKFLSEGMFLYRGFSPSQSEYPLFLHFPGLLFKIFSVKVEAF